MKIGAMNHPARGPLEEIDWFGRQRFDLLDFMLEPPAADPDQIDPQAIRAALDRSTPLLRARAWRICSASAAPKAVGHSPLTRAARS
jgi:hypothetical protein